MSKNLLLVTSALFFPINKEADLRSID